MMRSTETEEIQILFDFEFFGDPCVDVHLLELMMAMKREIRKSLRHFEQEIVLDRGLILVTLRAARVSLRYHFSEDSRTSEQVKAILEAFEWEKVIDRYCQVNNN